MLIFLLKLIGIILLCILGILLAVILLVLFAPVRYYAEFEYNKEMLRLNVSVTWLVVFRFYMKLYQKDFSYKFKILFFDIINSGKKRETKKTPAKEKKAEKMPDEMQHSGQERAADENETEKAETIEKAETTETKTETTEKTEAPEKITEAKDGTISRTITDSTQEKQDAAEKNKKRFSLMHPAELFDIIITKILDVCDIISKKLRAAGRNLDKVCEMITSPENKEMVLFILTQIKKLCRHIKPKKHGIYVKAGFNDSSLTGQVFGAYSVVNNILALNFILEPDFDREVLEARVYMKGRIRVINLLIIAIRVYSNKTLRKLIRRK